MGIQSCQRKRAQNERTFFSRAANERCYFNRALAIAPLTFPRKSDIVSTAPSFGKERCVSGARKDEERTKVLKKTDNSRVNDF